MFCFIIHVYVYVRIYMYIYTTLFKMCIVCTCTYVHVLQVHNTNIIVDVYWKFSPLFPCCHGDVNRGVWPTFFPQGQWKTAVLLVHVVGTAIQLCVSHTSHIHTHTLTPSHPHTHTHTHTHTHSLFLPLSSSLSPSLSLPPPVQESNQIFRDFLLNGQSSFLNVSV